MDLIKDKSRRAFLKTLGLVAASVAMPDRVSGLVSSAVRESGRKPNIILIMADDMGYGDIGCYGNTSIRTPSLDAMAAGGMRFTDFHTNGPLCGPTRAALLTGCYQQRVGMYIFPKSKRFVLPRALPREEITFAETLKSVGYATFLIGKWHLGDQPPFLPTYQGFDDFFGLPYSNDMIQELKNRFPPLPLYSGEEVIELNPDQNHLTQRYTEEAIKFIKKNKNSPFLLYLPHSMPHRPLAASERFTKRFTKEQMASIKGLEKKSRDFLYSAAIEEIDWSVGEIMRTLKDLGIEKNTLFIFTSDNGPAIGSAGPLRGGKRSLYEGGHRVPFIAYWPEQIMAGIVKDDIAMTMDLLPTMAEMAGATLPVKQIDGTSLLPLFLNQGVFPKRTLFWRSVQHKKVTEAIRSGPWKLLLLPASTALYHLDKDIAEKNNIIKKHPAKSRELMARLDEWERYVNADGKNGSEW